jgi:hypothetical protein
VSGVAVRENPLKKLLTGLLLDGRVSGHPPPLLQLAKPGSQVFKAQIAEVV